MRSQRGLRTNSYVCSCAHAPGCSALTFRKICLDPASCVFLSWCLFSCTGQVYRTRQYASSYSSPQSKGSWEKFEHVHPSTLSLRKHPPNVNARAEGKASVRRYSMQHYNSEKMKPTIPNENEYFYKLSNAKLTNTD